MNPGLTESDVYDLAEKFSIFVPLNGRISVSAINS
jgi:aspartate/tyrosine/aromatic aminotransferase